MNFDDNQKNIKYADVSVVIPCFCCSETINRAVNSILSQDHLPREIIFVDDCSCDDGRTLKFLYDIQNKYINILSIKILQLSKNVGPGSARNAGWNSASQKYVALLDADDAWHPNKIRIQEHYMNVNPDVSICGHGFSFAKNGLNNKCIPEESQIVVQHLFPIDFLFKNQFPTSSVMFKRSIPFRFLDGRRYAEDTLLWQQASYNSHPIARINLPLVFYYKSHYGEGGLSNRLWDMEKGELSNFILLLKSKKIGIILFFSSFVFSLLKFIRRYLKTVFYLN